MQSKGIRMKINIKKTTLTLFIYLTSLSMPSVHACNNNQSKIKQFEEDCITKIKILEKNMQTAFNDFHNQFAQELYIEKENLNKNPYPKHQQAAEKLEDNKEKIHNKLEDRKQTVAHNLNTSKQKLIESLETGKHKVHDKLEAGKQTVAKNVNAAKHKLNENIETAKHQVHSQLVAGKESAANDIAFTKNKLSDTIEAGRHKTHEMLDATKRKFNVNIENGKHKIHDKLEIGKHKTHDALAHGKQNLEIDLQKISHELSPQYLFNTRNSPKFYEYSTSSLTLANNNRIIKINKDKNLSSTKYIIHDIHKNNKTSYHQECGNIPKLKKLQKYIKKHFDSKIAVIILEECINNINCKRNTVDIIVLDSNKEKQHEKYVIEITPKKKHKRINTKPKNKKALLSMQNINYNNNQLHRA
jgi:hypothetical protein